MGFLAALPAGLISSLAGAFFKTLFESLFGFLDKQAQDRTHEQLGASRVTARVNQQTAETLDAMAQVQRPTDDQVEGGLAGGTF